MTRHETTAENHALRPVRGARPGRATPWAAGALLALFVFLDAPPPARGDELTIYVVAHPTVSLHGDRAELATVFTSRRRFDLEGRPLTPLNLPIDHPARQVFDRVVLGLTRDQVGTFWIDQRIRGEARPPRQIPGPELVARLVPRLAGAVGYVTVAPTTDELRILAEIRNGRVEPR